MSLRDILNNDEENDDRESLQKKHKGLFVFSSPPSPPSPPSPLPFASAQRYYQPHPHHYAPSHSSSSYHDDSDLAIQTLHSLAGSFSSSSSSSHCHPHSSHSSHSSSPYYIKREPLAYKFEHRSPSPTQDRKRSWDSIKPPSPSSLLSSPPSCSRRDYKKKQLVVRPELMQMKQAKAAVKLGIPPSTFSKRWRESLPDRKWPYRIHKKVEKSIQMLKVLQNKGHDVTADLNRLHTQRELNLKPALITMFEDVNESFEIDTSTATTTSSSSETPSSSSSSSSSSAPSSASSLSSLSSGIGSALSTNDLSPPLSPADSSSPSSPASSHSENTLSTGDEMEEEKQEEKEESGKENEDGDYNSCSPLDVPIKKEAISQQ